MEHNDESSSRKSAVAVPPPFYIEEGGPLNYSIDVSTRHLVDTKGEELMDKWSLPDSVDIIKPANLDNVRFAPPNCIVVYVLTFELGLRFPLHPFIRELLNFLNVTVVELYPNA